MELVRGALAMEAFISQQVGVDTGPVHCHNLLIVLGHGPWGISHSLGTGKVMAEMVESKPLSANVKSLSL